MAFTVRTLAFASFLALLWPAVPGWACDCADVGPGIAAAVAAGSWDEAERQLAAAIARGDSPSAHLCRARMLLTRAGEHTQTPETSETALDPALASAALVELESAIARWPGEPAPHRCALEVLQSRGDHAGFLLALRRAGASLRPLGMETAVDALLPYPKVYLERKQHEKASDAHLALLEIYPDSEELHSSQGAVLLAQGDLEAASERFARAFELDPRDPLVLGNAANAALFRRDFAAARRFYELALREDPASTSRYFDLAAIALHGGAAAALPAWRRYLEQHARVPDVDPWPQLAEDIAARLERTPTSRDLDQIAQELIRAGAPAQALPVLVGAAEREPGEAIHAFLLASAYDRGGFPDLALEELLRVQRMLEEDPVLETPSRAAAAYETGRVALELRRMDLAIRNLEYATRESPAHGDAHYALGVAYQRAGRSAEAHEAYRLCLWAERPSGYRESCRKGFSDTAPASAAPGAD
jgi:Flp pilus assembly protein TadD